MATAVCINGGVAILHVALLVGTFYNAIISDQAGATCACKMYHRTLHLTFF